MLSPVARKLAGQLADAIEAGDTATVVALVDGCKLPHVQRLEICTVLAKTTTNTALAFDAWERAYTVRAAA